MAWSLEWHARCRRHRCVRAGAAAPTRADRRAPLKYGLNLQFSQAVSHNNQYELVRRGHQLQQLEVQVELWPIPYA